MKKIKFLILALLGITIIPTATNALNTTNYTKVYRQCLGRSDDWMLDKSQPRIYCADTSYNSANRFIPYGANGLNSFKASRNLYWNGPYYNSSAYVKGQLLDTIGYFYFGYDKNPQNEKIDVSEFTINLPKNGLVNFFRFGKSKDYTDFLPNRFGLTLLDTTVVSDWKVATSVGGTMLYGKYIAYENNKLVVYDFENKIRYVWGKIDNLEVDHIHGGYAVLRAIKNQKPEEVYRVEFASSNAAGYIPVFSESWQSDLVYGYKMEEILESKMVSEYDSNPQIGGGNSENPQENYNQCLAYYNSVKTYASYDRNCYKDLLDNNQDIGLRQQITDWDGEGEGPATDNRICNLWKGYKKSYKTKFKDKWSEFLELSSANRLSPHSLNVKDYCGEKPRDDKNWLDGLGLYFKKISGIEKVGVKDGREISKAYFDDDNLRLSLAKNRCENPSAFSFGFPIWKSSEDLKKEFCDEYEKIKLEYAQKYEGIQLYSGYSQIYSGIIENTDPFGLYKLKDRFLSDFNKGKSVFLKNSQVCSNPVFFEERDFLVYIPFFMFTFLVIKYMFR